LEETYETLEALDSEEPAKMVEELGDLLIQVVFHSQIGQDNGTFTIQDVVRGINEKLLRRHPHIFGDAQVANSSEVKVQWDQIKAQERQDKGQGDRSALDGVPKFMPALAYAQAIQGRAVRAGFVWENDAQVLVELAEEVKELKTVASHEKQEQELGDLLLSVVDTASRMGVEAEEALREANNRFYRRYVHMERSSQVQELQMDKLSLESKLELWWEAKASTGDA
jgi:tetrapyrrole methylase family protein/MazG family protein